MLHLPFSGAHRDRDQLDQQHRGHLVQRERLERRDRSRPCGRRNHRDRPRVSALCRDDCSTCHRAFRGGSYPTQSTTGTFINNGTISANGGAVGINIGSFINAGLVAVNGGDLSFSSSVADKQIDAGNLDINSGYLEIGNQAGGHFTLSDTVIRLGSSGSATLLALSNTIFDTTAQIIQSGHSVLIDADSYNSPRIVNDGLITGAIAGGTLAIGSANSDGESFANRGTIAISNGDTLVFGTYVTLSGRGKIDATDATVQISTLDQTGLAMLHMTDSTIEVLQTLLATGSTLTLGHGSHGMHLQLGGAQYGGGYSMASMQGGTVHDGGGGVSFLGTVTLQDVAYDGTLTIDRPSTTVTLAGQTAIAGRDGIGAGSISLTGAQSLLADNAYLARGNLTLSIGNSGGLDGASDAPRLELGAGSSTLEGSFAIVQVATYAAVGNGTGAGNLTGSITDDGTITAAIAGGMFTIDGLSFTNAGSIAVSNADTLVSASATFINTGRISLSDGTLDLNLTNYFQSYSTAPQSFENDGIITLAGGRILEPTFGHTYPRVPMLNAAGGSISGSGTLSVAVNNLGRIEASGGTLAVTELVSGPGTLQIDNGATLSVGRIAAMQTAVFAGASGILALSPMQFLGTIAGFAPGDTLDLTSTQAASAAFSGDNIVITLTSGLAETLHTTAPLTGTLLVTPGSHGDSLVTFASAGAALHDVREWSSEPEISHTIFGHWLSPV